MLPLCSICITVFSFPLHPLTTFQGRENATPEIGAFELAGFSRCCVLGRSARVCAGCMRRYARGLTLPQHCGRAPPLHTPRAVESLEGRRRPSVSRAAGMTPMMQWLWCKEHPGETAAAAVPFECPPAVSEPVSSRLLRTREHSCFFWCQSGRPSSVTSASRSFSDGLWKVSVGANGSSLRRWDITVDSV